MAERHVLLGARNIARQQRVVEDIVARGHPADLAREILKTFEDVQVEYMAHRIWLLTSPFRTTPAEPRILHLATRLSLALIKRRHARRVMAK
jgi:hypothetical protein